MPSALLTLVESVIADVDGASGLSARALGKKYPLGSVADAAMLWRLNPALTRTVSLRLRPRLVEMPPTFEL